MKFKFRFDSHQNCSQTKDLIIKSYPDLLLTDLPGTDPMTFYLFVPSTNSQSVDSQIMNLIEENGGTFIKKVI